MIDLRSLLCVLGLATTLAGSPAFDAAVALYNQAKPAEAKPAFEAVATAEPANQEAVAYIGRCLDDLNDPDGAVKIFEKLTAASPTHSDYFRELGDAYGMKAAKAGAGLSGFRYARKAKAAWVKAIALDPANLEAHFNLLQFDVQAPSIVGGGIDKAYGEAAAIKKLSPARGAEADEMVYTADKKYPEAFAALEVVLKAKSTDYAANYRFGRLAAISGQRLDDGLTALKKCLLLPPPKDTPPHAAVQWRIGVIWEKKGDPTAARTAYQAAVSADSRFSQAIEALRKLDSNPR